MVKQKQTREIARCSKKHNWLPLIWNVSLERFSAHQQTPLNNRVFDLQPHDKLLCTPLQKTYTIKTAFCHKVNFETLIQIL